MKPITLAIALAAVSTAASAQTSQSFFGRDGKFQGSAQTSGNSTSFYNRNGQFDGSAIRSGNSTSLYDRNGHFAGQVFTQPQSGSNPFGRK
jgi:hypothetical protein